RGAVGDAPGLDPEDEQAGAARPDRVPGVVEAAVEGEGDIVRAMRREYFAPCTLGLEEVVAAEVRELGGGDVTIRRGAVSFSGDRRLGYAANLWLRSAVRVQERVAEFKAKGREELEEGVGAIEWERWLAPGG